jgi:hypothetical protein
MEFMGKKDSSAKGTWKQSGDQLTFLTTEEDGAKQDPPDEQKATLKDGKIVMPMKDGGGKGTLVLRKK